MLNRKTRKVTKVVGVLTDPHPEFVSLVNFPANQTPFSVIKLDPARAEENATALAQRAASAVVDIASITFSKKLFKTTEAVTEYMEANGYENYAVVDQGEFFLVPGRESDDFEGDTKSITIKKGVEMTVGRLRPARKSAAAATPPADEPVSAFKSMYSVSIMGDVLSSIAYMLSDMKWEDEYLDEASPVTESMKAWLGTGAELFKGMAADEASKLVEWSQKMKAEKAKEEEAVSTAKAAKDGVDGTTTPVAAPAKAPTAVKPAATATVENPDPKPAEQPAGTTEPTTPPQDAANVVPPADAPAKNPGETTETGDGVAVVTTDPPEPVAEETAEQKAAKATLPPGFTMEAFATLLGDSMGKAVEKAMEPVNAKLTAVEEKITKSDERIEAIEAGTRQVRKSGDTETTTAPSTRAAGDAEETKKAEAFRQRQNRNSFGI